MAEKKADRPKNPLVEVKIKCKNCQARQTVKVFRTRIDKPAKPQYKVFAEVEIDGQTTFVPEESEDDEVEVTTDETE